MTMILLLLTTFLLSVAGAAAADRNDAVLLRYRVSPGDSCFYDMNLNTGMAMRGMAASAGSLMQSVFAVHVKDSTGPQLGINVDVREMKASMRGAPGMRDTTIDLIGESAMGLRVIIDRRGNLLFAWPSSELVQAYQTGGQLAGGGIQNSLRKIFLVYPADSVRPGSTWQTTTLDTSSSSGSTIVTRMVSTFTYAGIADTLGTRCARISIASDSVTVDGSYPANSLKINGSGKLAGVYYVDIASGMPLTGAVQSDIDMEFSPLGTTSSQGKPPVQMHNTSDLVLQRRAAVR